LLNEKEKTGWIFEDPAEVLGRAIQPPKLENIKGSVKNLLNVGALQVVRKRGFSTLRITNIGKLFSNVPCDLKLCKLCLMGFLFGCLDECTTIACIL
jgi:ATP-dependent RNA helicase TDRD9